MADDWYRSKTWTPDVEAAFEERLSRARSKDQYLRIQALSLVETHPDVALALIDRFFALKDPFFPAAGFDVKAKALVRLGRVPEALVAYESAIEAEHARPSPRTNAATDFAELVVLTGAQSRYTRALEILEERQSELAFPVLRFIAHACKAVILQHQGRLARAEAEVAAALAEANRSKSGFQYHQGLGLVSDAQMPLLKLLRGFRAG